MNRTGSLVVVVALLAVALSSAAAGAGDVNINIGWPPPLIIEKPRVVLVPETKVYTAPSLEFNVFMFGGKYWSLHGDNWFVAARVGAPWSPVVIERVPLEIRAVPVKYYKVPPGHAKKMKDKGDDDDDGHPGKGHKGCPPGLAKQGRC
ncbi:MAG TPA: hypothetical protein VGT02_01665 [Methylomirabilota bacterium]|jgi:hypothetical protein|nr:hypothetical protein [Methylomirabilota bacterium]